MFSGSGIMNNSDLLGAQLNRYFVSHLFMQWNGRVTLVQTAMWIIVIKEFFQIN